MLFVGSSKLVPAEYPVAFSNTINQVSQTSIQKKINKKIKNIYVIAHSQVNSCYYSCQIRPQEFNKSENYDLQTLQFSCALNLSSMPLATITLFSK